MGEHIDDHIERKARTDGTYAIAYAILHLSRGLTHASIAARNTAESAAVEVGGSLREMGSGIAQTLSDVAAALENITPQPNGES